jgi:DNA (cytosine-5)-methyltransferase 1
MADQMSGLRAIDLFSCLGFHGIGLEAAGIEMAGFCEIRPERRAIIQKRWPHVRVFDDVTKLDAVTGSADILTGGPPCQRTSLASAIHGRRTGESLWPHMRRFCNQLQPQWVVVEQPPGNRPWENEVSSDLAHYRWHTARVEFSAADVGAPHIRRRVFILANRSLSRLESAWQAIPSEIDAVARATAAGGVWTGGPPESVRVVDGRPHRPNRIDAIEAIGDSNPPQMMEVIGRAIVRAAA